MFQAIEHNDIKKGWLSNVEFIPKVNALLLSRSPAHHQAVLNYMGFEAGPTRLPLVAPALKRSYALSKVVVDGDYATKEIVQEFFVRIIDVLDS